MRPALFLIPLAFAISETYKSHQIDSVDQLSASILKNNAVVTVKLDRSVILSDYYLTMAQDPNIEARMSETSPSDSRFIQTVFQDMPAEVTVSEWIPYTQCITNWAADTAVTITRTYSAAIGPGFGPHIFFTILGALGTINLRWDYSHLVSEKISCDIEPGATLQLHSQTETTCLAVEKKRTIEVKRQLFNRLSYGDWEESDDVCFTVRKLACVTDASLLQC